MNEKQIKALIKEAEAAAKKYKAELNAKSKGSVKIVAPTSDSARATANKKEELRLKTAKSGLAAKNTAAAKESMYKKTSKTKTTTPKVRGGGMRGPINLGGSGGALGKIK